MSKKSMIKPLTIALGTVFTVSLANISISNADENPFSMKPLAAGNMMLAEGKDGKCGASKGKMDMGKEGKCGAGKGKMGMGKEGMCGMNRMDTDGDGKVSKEEFVKGHESKFGMIDKDGDGFIDKSESEAHMKMMKDMMGKTEGKCGGSK